MYWYVVTVHFSGNRNSIVTSKLQSYKDLKKIGCLCAGRKVKTSVKEKIDFSLLSYFLLSTIRNKIKTNFGGNSKIFT